MAGLLEQITDLPDWHSRAQCRGASPKIFFPRGYSGEMISLAKSMCQVCEVRLECLDYAVKTNQPEGIWGGMTPQERKRVRIVRTSA